jgi:Fe(3+) dicitrate transport protein
MKKLTKLLILSLWIKSLPLLFSQTRTTNLEPVVVNAKKESKPTVQSMIPAAAQGNKSLVGKHATVTELSAFPEIQNNNLRQAFQFTPGLIVSEESTPLVSIGFHGMGTPDRAQFMQVLKDGIPIHADQFGYPEAYYTPFFEAVERIDFIRGGASLMFGPQPGGAINFITHQLSLHEPLSFGTKNLMGSDDQFINYTFAQGSLGQFSYYAGYNHRRGEGFRNFNSDYFLDSLLLKTRYYFNEDTHLSANLDLYSEEHGEPGNLSYNDFTNNPDRSWRQYDRFRLKRYSLSLQYEQRLSENTLFNTNLWFTYYDRWSKRQLGFGFGAITIPGQLNSNNVESQKFYTFGIEPRLTHEWQGLGAKNTFSGGVQFYMSHSPRVEQRGSTPDAESGVIFNDVNRDVLYGSLFLENSFKWGALTITPSFRMEMINQEISENRYNATTGIQNFSANYSQFDPQPLFGLGINYALTPNTELYANVSQSYRATIFSQSIIAPPNTVATGADPALTWQYALGYRGNHEQWLSWDTSLFYIDMDNKYGISGTNLTSVGRSLHYGVDLSLQVDLFHLLSVGNQGSLGALKWHISGSWLNAELNSGSNTNGKTPQYAPEYQIRTGLNYELNNKIKFGFNTTYLADHYGSDDEAANRFIPAYIVCDLTAEYKMNKNLTFIAGINNLFDESYFSRINNNGIDPAYGRNAYLGVTLSY